MTPTEAAEDWCDAWNVRDLDRVLSHYTDDIEVRSPLVMKRLGQEVLIGKDALRDYFAIGMTNPDLHFTLVAVLEGVSEVTVLYRRETGRLVADTSSLTAEGKIRRMIACYERE